MAERDEKGRSGEPAPPEQRDTSKDITEPMAGAPHTREDEVTEPLDRPSLAAIRARLKKVLAEPTALLNLNEGNEVSSPRAAHPTPVMLPRREGPRVALLTGEAHEPDPIKPLDVERLVTQLERININDNSVLQSLLDQIKSEAGLPENTDGLITRYLEEIIRLFTASDTKKSEKRDFKKTQFSKSDYEKLSKHQGEVYFDCIKSVVNLIGVYGDFYKRDGLAFLLCRDGRVRETIVAGFCLVFDHLHSLEHTFGNVKITDSSLVDSDEIELNSLTLNEHTERYNAWLVDLPEELTGEEIKQLLREQALLVKLHLAYFDRYAQKDIYYSININRPEGGSYFAYNNRRFPRTTLELTLISLERILGTVNKLKTLLGRKLELSDLAGKKRSAQDLLVGLVEKLF